MAKLAGPSTWWTGAEREPIATGVCTAGTCLQCLYRKAAITPSAVTRQHDTTGTVPCPTFDMIHRVTTALGRLSKEGYELLVADIVEETHYIKALGVVIRTDSGDSFCRGSGVPLHPMLPDTGNPSRRQPSEAQMDVSLARMIANGQVTEPHVDVYWRNPAPHTQRAMSLVPGEVRPNQHIPRPRQHPDPAASLNTVGNCSRAAACMVK